MKIQLLAGVAGVALVAFAPGANAFVSWQANAQTGQVGPSGQNSILGWSGGGSDNGLFGSPVVTADTFFFIANNNFSAVAFDGGTQTTADSLRVHVYGVNGNAFSQIVFESTGDYQVFGQGSSVNIGGSMSVTDSNSSASATDSFHATTDNPHPGGQNFPQFDTTGQGNSDSWHGYSMIDFAASGLGPLTAIDLVFSNNLVAVTMPGSNASIANLPNSEGSFSLQLIPAPSAGLGLLAGLGVLSRRRRS
jgi:hypothetical protein